MACSMCEFKKTGGPSRATGGSVRKSRVEISGGLRGCSAEGEVRLVIDGGDGCVAQVSDSGRANAQQHIRA